MEEIHMHPFVFIVSLLVEKGRHLFSKSRQRLFQPSVLMAHPTNMGGLRIKFCKPEKEEFDIRHPS